MNVIELVVEKMRQLPPAQQLEVLDFAESLKHKQEQRRPLYNPEGLWAGKGPEITEEDLAAARAEMWGKYDREEVP